MQLTGRLRGSSMKWEVACVILLPKGDHRLDRIRIALIEAEVPAAVAHWEEVGALPENVVGSDVVAVAVAHEEELGTLSDPFMGSDELLRVYDMRKTAEDLDRRKLAIQEPARVHRTKAHASHEAEKLCRQQVQVQVVTR